MALAYLAGARGQTHRMHDAANVNPFHDPENTQHVLIANQSVVSPALGTAAELRGRRPWRLRLPGGSYAARPSSEPPAEIERQPTPPPAPLGHGADDDAGDSDPSDAVYEWNAARLNTLDQDVYVNIASQIHRLHWRLDTLENKQAQRDGETGFKQPQQIRRERYDMSQLSSPAMSSPQRAAPGEQGPTEELYDMSTPPRSGTQRDRGFVW